jgi:hypothetical protein
MLSSYPIGGEQERRRDGQQQQGNPQKQKKKGQPQEEPGKFTFIPPKFHGIIDKERVDVIVKHPKNTFQVPFGVDIDPVFDYIRNNNPTEIAPLLKNKKHDVNKTKLFDGAFIPGPVAVYYGHLKAAKDFQKYVVDVLETSLNKSAEAKAIKNVTTPNFIESARSVIDSLIEEEFGELFNEDHKDKAKSILYVFDKLYKNLVFELVEEFKSKTNQPSSSTPAPSTTTTSSPSTKKSFRGKKSKRGKKSTRGGVSENKLEDYGVIEPPFDAEEYMDVANISSGKEAEVKEEPKTEKETIKDLISKRLNPFESKDTTLTEDITKVYSEISNKKDLEDKVCMKSVLDWLTTVADKTNIKDDELNTILSKGVTKEDLLHCISFLNNYGDLELGIQVPSKVLSIEFPTYTTDIKKVKGYPAFEKELSKPIVKETPPEKEPPQFSSFGGGKYNKSVQYKALFLPIENTYSPTQPNWYEIPASSFNNLTSLQYAAGYGSVGSVSVLIRNGADYKATTKDGVSLRDFAQSRPNEIRKNEVTKLLTAVFIAVDAAFSDVGLKKMKSNYVDEGKVPDESKKFEDTLNYVYTKEFKSIRKLTTPGSVLSKKEEDAKKKGKEDGRKNSKDDVYMNSDDDAIKQEYALGFEMGQAEIQGELDGSAEVPTERDSYVTHAKPEVQKAYKEAFLKAKGKYIVKGFEDGIRGKESSPPNGQVSSLGFDPAFSKMIQLGTVDPKIQADYDTGYNIGIDKFANFIPTLIGTSPNSGAAIADGLIDGKAGTKFKTTFKLKTKPLLGSNQYGTDETEFDINYGDLDVEKAYGTVSIPIPKERGIGPNKYGAYILSLYEEGYAQGQRNKEKGGSKTYRRKRSGKSKTYKKKLSKK